MPRRKKPGRVSEPVQVYLDPRDRAMLEKLAGETGLSRAELLRRGLRRLASDKAERRPGWSLDYMIGILGDDPSLPTDLAERHDYYIYGEGRKQLPYWKDRPARSD